jgi:EmrB/QacA subfamily drug resistance transporter
MQNENKILVILVLGMIMGALDTTIVLLALPTITQSLHTDLSVSIWVILIYLLIVAVATTQLGRIGDIFGRSRMFNAGFAIFTIGSILCGFSPDVLFLIASRGLQAIGGSLLEANSGAIIADTFDKDKRGRAFGFLGIGWNVGAVLGIVLGGMITTFAGWRFIFYMNVPIGILALIFGLRYLKDSEVVKESIDLTGMILLAAILGLVSYGLVDFAGSGLSAANELIMGTGLLLLPLFLWWESRIEAPLIHLSVFKDRILRSSILAAFFQSFGYLSVAFVMTLYLQGVRALDPFNAALLLLPGYLVSCVLSPFMGRYADRYGARLIATLGIALMCITVIIYISLGAATPLYYLVLASLFAGVGGSMFWPANNSAVMARATADRHGATAGLLRTMTNIGTLGSYVLALTAASAAVPRQLAFSIFLGTSAIAGGLPPSFLAGLHAALFVSLCLLVVAGILSFTRGVEDRAAAYPPPS